MSGLVAIAIRGGADLGAHVDPHFGRADSFLLVEASGGNGVQVLRNAAAQGEHGAGVGAAALMVRHGVGAVVAGRFGPKAYDALRAAGIAMHVASEDMTAGQALERLRAGTLERYEVKTY